MTGTIKMWKEDGGYGFIARATGSDLFVHVSDIGGGLKHLVPGDVVEFEIGAAPKGPKAIKVRVLK